MEMHPENSTEQEHVSRLSRGFVNRVRVRFR
jgi:hypothetical protein